MKALKCACLAAALAVAAACDDGKSGPVAGDDLQNLKADQIVYGLVHYLTSSGIRRGLLRADSAYLFDDSARMALYNPHVVFFDEVGAQNGELTARTGNLNVRTDAMTARGDVVLVTRVGDRRVESAELHYDPEQDRIWSDSATVLQESGTTLRGRGFSSDGRFERVRILQPTGRLEGVRVDF